MCDSFNTTVRPLKPRNHVTYFLSVHKSVLPKHITGIYCKKYLLQVNYRKVFRRQHQSVRLPALGIRRSIASRYILRRRTSTGLQTQPASSVVLPETKIKLNIIFRFIGIHSCNFFFFELTHIIMITNYSRQFSNL